MSGCGLNHHNEAVRLTNKALDLLTRASGPEQADMFQRQALGFTAAAQAHATLAAAGYLCIDHPPMAQEPEKFPWDDPS